MNVPALGGAPSIFQLGSDWMCRVPGALVGLVVTGAPRGGSYAS